MHKMMIGDMEFQFEKLNEEHFRSGAAAFRVIDKDGRESYWVNCPATRDRFNDGIATPKDGRMVAFCHTKEDALMVASAINVSAAVAGFKLNSLKKECEELADEIGVDVDIDKMRAEVNRLKADGKTDKEVAEILKQRIDEFLTSEGKAKKEAALKERGEW